MTWLFSQNSQGLSMQFVFCWIWFTGSYWKAEWHHDHIRFIFGGWVERGKDQHTHTHTPNPKNKLNIAQCRFFSYQFFTKKNLLDNLAAHDQEQIQSLYLFSKNEKRWWILDVLAAERAVDRWFVDECIVPLSGKNFPLLLVVADIGVDPKSKQGDYNIQIIIWSSVVKRLSHQTFCWQRTEDWLTSTGLAGQHSRVV